MGTNTYRQQHSHPISIRRNNRHQYACFLILWVCTTLTLTSCREKVVTSGELPPIWPDYIGVTIPAGIAPLDFGIEGDWDAVYAEVKGNNGQTVKARGRWARFNIRRWHRLTEGSTGSDLSVTVAARQGKRWTQFRPFFIHVSTDSLTDYGVVYRKIAPGYETYSKIGNYQRDIHTFRENPIIESTLTPGQCVNCHTANATDPEQYTFHLRGKHGATYFQVGDAHKWVTTKTDQTISNAVYPYWHPSGDYCACSNNYIHQSFWTARERLIEVWDDASDISVVDVRSDEVITSPLVHTDYYETYPAFSPDGQTLYYCTSYPYPVPARASEVRYDLCSISFDATTGTLGSRVDTLIHAAAAGKSVTFPRPSYDGRFILYCEADFGCFPIDHQEADLWLYEVATGNCWPLDGANSNYAESFHNWSSNSRWILFSSRRHDGLYSLLYICHVDENGVASKPFLLPQRNPQKYYGESLYSYNVPDFTKRRVQFNATYTWREVSSDERVQATPKDPNILNNETENIDSSLSPSADRFMQ